MSQAPNIAIVGATGEVGKAIIAQLEEAELELGILIAVASERSIDETLMFRGRPVLLNEVGDFDFAKVQIAVFAVPAEVAEEYVPQALAAGCVVIDHSTAFRFSPEASLAVAGLNIESLPAGQRLFACADATTATVAPLLGALNARAGLSRVQMTVLRAVSAAGQGGIRELAKQTGELLNARGIDSVVFPQQVAFNVLPLVGEVDVAGRSPAEAAIADELRDLLGRPDLPVDVTCVTVPVFFGHAVSLSVDTEQELGLAEAAHILSEIEGVELQIDMNDQGVATPVTDAAGRDAVYVSRLREATSGPQGLQAWIVADNVRQGAARHSVETVKKVIKDFKY